MWLCEGSAFASREHNKEEVFSCQSRVGTLTTMKDDQRRARVVVIILLLLLVILRMTVLRSVDEHL